MNLDNILKNRTNRYGEFFKLAVISQRLLRIALHYNKELASDDIFREGLALIFHKIARAINGDNYYKDNYIDIAGYSKLLLKHCRDIESDNYNGKYDTVFRKLITIVNNADNFKNNSIIYYSTLERLIISITNIITCDYKSKRPYNTIINICQELEGICDEKRKRH